VSPVPHGSSAIEQIDGLGDGLSVGVSEGEGVGVSVFGENERRFPTLIPNRSVAMRVRAKRRKRVALGI
jgi:hypothetical protein